MATMNEIERDSLKNVDCVVYCGDPKPCTMRNRAAFAELLTDARANRIAQILPALRLMQVRVQGAECGVLDVG